MTPIRFLLLTLCLALLSAAAMAAPPFAADRVLVRFAEPAGREAATAATLPLPTTAVIRALGERRAARPVRKLVALPGSDRWHLIAGLDGADVPALVAALEADPRIAAAEPDYVGTGGAVVVDDPDLEDQWPLMATRINEAWAYTRGSEEVVLAVLDTGIDFASPEYERRLVPGFDFVNDDNDPTDDHGHGSWVTSVAAANADNAFAMAGVDHRCRIMPLKVLDDRNIGFYSDWADAIHFAIENGADVINLSAGGVSRGEALAQAVEAAINAGLIFVTISHNQGENDVRFPGEMPAAITVGATRAGGEIWLSSNYGPEIDLVAPGSLVPVLAAGSSRYSLGSGTSFAAPLVAGVACLLRGLDPDLDQAAMEDLLRASANPRRAVPPLNGFDERYGWGELNARGALALLLGTDLHAEVLPGGHTRLSWSVPAALTGEESWFVASSDDGGATWTPVLPAPDEMIYDELTGRYSWIDPYDPERFDQPRLYRVFPN